MSVVAAARGLFLDKSSTNNELLNSNYDQDNYPVWTAYNGVKTGASTTSSVDSYGGIASWVHYSPLFNEGYASYIGNQFKYHYEPYATDGFYPFDPVPRSILVYGAQSLMAGITSVNNDNPDRGATQFGSFSNTNNTRIVSHTTSSNDVTSGSDMSATNLWTRVTEWQQHLDIPDNVTSIKFGAQIKVDANDRLKELNFGGIYCAEDDISNKSRVVNYFAVRHTDATFTLPTGSLTGNRAHYNWNGLRADHVLVSGNVGFFTACSLTVTEKAMLDQNDYADWQKVEYTFTPQSGTSRHMTFNIFFAENTSYLHDSPAGNTGGFQVFDPFVEFTTS